MNILFIKHFFVGLMVSKTECPYSVTFPHIYFPIYYERLRFNLGFNKLYKCIKFR